MAKMELEWTSEWDNRLNNNNNDNNISKTLNISKIFGYFLQNLEKLVKLQVKFAIKNCKQKLQVSFEFKTSKTRFYKQPATRFEFSKKEKFEKISKIHILSKNISKNSGIFGDIFLITYDFLIFLQIFLF